MPTGFGASSICAFGYGYAARWGRLETCSRLSIGLAHESETARAQFDHQQPDSQSAAGFQPAPHHGMTLSAYLACPALKGDQALDRWVPSESAPPETIHRAMR